MKSMNFLKLFDIPKLLFKNNKKFINVEIYLFLTFNVSSPDPEANIFSFHFSKHIIPPE